VFSLVNIATACISSGCYDPEGNLLAMEEHFILYFSRVPKKPLRSGNSALIKTPPSLFCPITTFICFTNVLHAFQVYKLVISLQQEVGNTKLRTSLN